MTYKCQTCVHRRAIAGVTEEIECKPQHVQPGDLLEGMYRFAGNGEITVPFKVSIVDKISGKGDNAWPFRFDPAIIGTCDGYMSTEE